jgi:hypothetical protein
MSVIQDIWNSQGQWKVTKKVTLLWGPTCNNWSGNRIPVGRDFPPVQTGPGANPASCTMGTGSFPGVKYGRGVLLTTHPLLVPWSWKSRAISLPTLWATTGPVTGTLYLTCNNYPFVSRVSMNIELRLRFIALTSGSFSKKTQVFWGGGGNGASVWSVVETPFYAEDWDSNIPHMFPYLENCTPVCTKRPSELHS